MYIIAREIKVAPMHIVQQLEPDDGGADFLRESAPGRGRE